MAPGFFVHFPIEWPAPAGRGRGTGLPRLITHRMTLHRATGAGGTKIRATEIGFAISVLLASQVAPDNLDLYHRPQWIDAQILDAVFTRLFTPAQVAAARRLTARSSAA